MTTSRTAVFDASRPYWQGGVWAGPDVHIGRVRLFDASVWLFYRRDEGEWARRAGGESSAVTDLGALDLLMDLPAGMDVSLESLPVRDRRLIARLPCGAVEVREDRVVRRFTPALTPLLAVAQAGSWKEALARASRFGAYLPRAVAVEQLPTDVDASLAAASLSGIGVFVYDDGALRERVAPEPLVGWQPTPAWWWLCEAAYKQVARAERRSG